MKTSHISFPLLAYQLTIDYSLQLVYDEKHGDELWVINSKND